jgi:hypothetical protein
LDKDGKSFPQLSDDEIRAQIYERIDAGLDVKLTSADFAKRLRERGGSKQPIKDVSRRLRHWTVERVAPYPLAMLARIAATLGVSADYILGLTATERPEDRLREFEAELDELRQEIRRRDEELKKAEGRIGELESEQQSSERSADALHRMLIDHSPEPGLTITRGCQSWCIHRLCRALAAGVPLRARDLLNEIGDTGIEEREALGKLRTLMSYVSLDIKPHLVEQHGPTGPEVSYTLRLRKQRMAPLYPLAFLLTFGGLALASWMVHLVPDGKEQGLLLFLLLSLGFSIATGRIRSAIQDFRFYERGLYRIPLAVLVWTPIVCLCTWALYHHFPASALGIFSYKVSAVLVFIAWLVGSLTTTANVCGCFLQGWGIRIVPKRTRDAKPIGP